MVVADVEIDADGFALETALSAGLDAAVEVERVVPSSGDPMPYVRSVGPELEAFDAALRECRTVEAATELDRTDRRRRYRIVWSDDVVRRLAGFARHRATIVAARGTDRWQFRLRVPSHEALSGFHDYCEGVDLGVSVDAIRPDATGSADRRELTAPQRRLLALALRRGYFEVPRETTLSELAADLDVSTQAASERLRRATTTVLEAAFADRDRPFDDGP